MNCEGQGELVGRAWKNVPDEENNMTTGLLAGNYRMCFSYYVILIVQFG